MNPDMNPDQPTDQQGTTPYLSIVVPPTWRRRSDPDRGVLVAARSTCLPTSGVRPELVLRYASVDDRVVTLSGWRDRAMCELAEMLDDFALEDDDEYDLLGQQVAYRRFAHRLGVADVLCDQWAWLTAGVGLTLTCSAARIDYPDYCDLFENVAETVDVLPGAA